jgi:hypothetical protein
VSQKQKHMFEGEPSLDVAGMRHYLILDPNYFRGDKRHLVSSLATEAGAKHFATCLRVVFHPVGTWEAPRTDMSGPKIKPEILSEIFGTKQKEMAV